MTIFNIISGNGDNIATTNEHFYYCQFPHELVRDCWFNLSCLSPIFSVVFFVWLHSLHHHVVLCWPFRAGKFSPQTKSIIGVVRETLNRGSDLYTSLLLLKKSSLARLAMRQTHNVFAGELHMIMYEQDNLLIWENTRKMEKTFWWKYDINILVGICFL